MKRGVQGEGSVVYLATGAAWSDVNFGGGSTLLIVFTIPIT